MHTGGMGVAMANIVVFEPHIEAIVMGIDLLRQIAVRTLHHSTRKIQWTPSWLATQLYPKND